MGIISIEQSGRLYWLGRYTERVFTTLKCYRTYFDTMLDRAPDAYRDFLLRLTLPDVYADEGDFTVRYLYDANNPDSILSNLTRAYDNAIVLRKALSTDMMGYIQMALDQMQAAVAVESPLYALQPVIDSIYAFWGAAGVPTLVVEMGIGLRLTPAYCEQLANGLIARVLGGADA